MMSICFSASRSQTAACPSSWCLATTTPGPRPLLSWCKRLAASRACACRCWCYRACAPRLAAASQDCGSPSARATTSTRPGRWCRSRRQPSRRPSQWLQGPLPAILARTPSAQVRSPGGKRPVSNPAWCAPPGRPQSSCSAAWPRPGSKGGSCTSSRCSCVGKQPRPSLPLQRRGISKGLIWLQTRCFPVIRMPGVTAWQPWPRATRMQPTTSAWPLASRLAMRPSSCCSPMPATRTPGCRASAPAARPRRQAPSLAMCPRCQRSCCSTWRSMLTSQYTWCLCAAARHHRLARLSLFPFGGFTL